MSRNQFAIPTGVSVGLRGHGDPHRAAETSNA